ncbi:MAG: WXG100 family type VII secretion target [Planctomycetota bacterium]
MAKASVDPAELRRFARDLKRFSTELQTLLGGLHGKMLGLERTWKDQEQRKFFEELQQTTKVLKRFLESSDVHVNFLMRKATLIEEYLEQR